MTKPTVWLCAVAVGLASGGAAGYAAGILSAPTVLPARRHGRAHPLRDPAPSRRLTRRERRAVGRTPTASSVRRRRRFRTFAEFTGRPGHHSVLRMARRGTL